MTSSRGFCQKLRAKHRKIHCETDANQEVHLAKLRFDGSEKLASPLGNTLDGFFHDRWDRCWVLSLCFLFTPAFFGGNDPI